jgi:hypothetical protein
VTFAPWQNSPPPLHPLQIIVAPRSHTFPTSSSTTLTSLPCTITQGVDIFAQEIAIDHLSSHRRAPISSQPFCRHIDPSHPRRSPSPLRPNWPTSEHRFCSYQWQNGAGECVGRAHGYGRVEDWGHPTTGVGRRSRPPWPTAVRRWWWRQKTRPPAIARRTAAWDEHPRWWCKTEMRGKAGRGRGWGGMGARRGGVGKRVASQRRERGAEEVSLTCRAHVLGPHQNRVNTIVGGSLYWFDEFGEEECLTL